MVVYANLQLIAEDGNGVEHEQIITLRARDEMQVNDLDNEGFQSIIGTIEESLPTDWVISDNIELSSISYYVPNNADIIDITDVEDIGYE